MIHPNPSEFINESKVFGVLGRVLVELSDLEYSLDSFALSVRNNHKSIVLDLSPSFPRQYQEKVDFLLGAVYRITPLRRVPVFATGELNLLSVKYQLEELNDIRKIIAHGSVSLTEQNKELTRWTFQRVAKVKDTRQNWRIEAVKLSTTFLCSVCLTASTMRRYVRNLIAEIDGEYKWEDAYQDDKLVREGRLTLSTLVEDGVIADYDGLFHVLGPID